MIRDACAVLRDEVLPTTDPVLASVEYRKYLPQALFYKVVHKVIYVHLCWCYRANFNNDYGLFIDPYNDYVEFKLGPNCPIVSAQCIITF